MAEPARRPFPRADRWRDGTPMKDAYECAPDPQSLKAAGGQGWAKKKDKFGTGEHLSPEAASPQSPAAAQATAGTPHTHSGVPVVPAPRRMKVFTVELVARGMRVNVTGPAETEWQAGEIIARRWPKARIVAIREGQV
jgi:hypothetical protein